MAVADYFIPMIGFAAIYVWVNSMRIDDLNEMHLEHTHAADGSVQGIGGWY